MRPSRVSGALYATLGGLALVLVGVALLVTKSSDPPIPSASASPPVAMPPPPTSAATAAATTAEAMPPSDEQVDALKIDLDEPAAVLPALRVPAPARQATPSHDVPAPIPRTPTATTATPPNTSPTPTTAASVSPKKKLDKAVESAIDTRR